MEKLKRRRKDGKGGKHSNKQRGLISTMSPSSGFMWDLRGELKILLVLLWLVWGGGEQFKKETSEKQCGIRASVFNYAGRDFESLWSSKRGEL